MKKRIWRGTGHFMHRVGVCDSQSTSDVPLHERACIDRIVIAFLIAAMKNTKSGENGMERSGVRVLSDDEKKTLLDTKEKLRSDADGSHSAEAMMVDVVKTLLDGLGRGDIVQVEAALASLGIHKEHDLYYHVGQLARNLHDSLNEFKQSLERENVTMTSTSIPDAADKLEAVISMTFEAAEKTLNLVDSQTDLLRRGALDLGALENWISAQPKLHESERKFLDSYIKREKERNGLIAATTNEIVMAQEFQDLTGQALKKVVKLVTGIEEQLISLITLFGLQDEVSEECREEKTEEPEPVEEDAQLGQDETDALLASLGF